MPIGDTIVARASAPGIGRRAIVRLSGPQTCQALAAIGIDAAPARLALIAKARLPTAARVDGSSSPDVLRLLPVLLITFEPGRSYTGQASAEIVMPNCRLLVERVIDCMCCTDGVRRAEPGEFTARAYLAGRLTLAEAEGVAAKIAAESARQLEAADRLLNGTSGDEYRAWSDAIAQLLALVEAGIDFTDQEDVVPITASALHDRLASLRARIRPLLGTSPASEWAGDRPLAVLIGPPNAGKSTLFNALLGRRRALASDLAGTTRDAIIEPLDLSDVGGPVIDLADLPGLDPDTVTELDRAAQQRALEMIARADILIACDPASRFDLPPTCATVIRVRTKSDGHLACPGSELAVCALDGWHLASLRRALAEHSGEIRRNDDALLIPRHRRIVASVLDELDAADEIAGVQHPDGLGNAEIIAARLRSALDLIGELAGQVTRDDVIGRIFATFCVGK